MNRQQALAHMRKHQPNSPWNFEPPTPEQARNHLQALAARGMPTDALNMTAAVLARSFAPGGAPLPPHILGAIPRIGRRGG